VVCSVKKKEPGLCSQGSCVFFCVCVCVCVFVSVCVFVCVCGGGATDDVVHDDKIMCVDGIHGFARWKVRVFVCVCVCVRMCV